MNGLQAVPDDINIESLVTDIEYVALFLAPRSLPH